MDALSCEDMCPDRIDQWHQGYRRRPDAVGKRRHVKLDAFPRIGVALAVQRQVQAVFGEQDMAEELGACTPARDRMRRRRRLRDRLAGAARELLTHVLDHFPLPRNEFQRLGHVLADLAQAPATTTWADC